MLQRVLTLIYKEFLAVWRDKKSRMVLIGPPLIQLFIFSFAATLDVQNVSMGILNRDAGEQSIELIQRFSGSPTFTHITFLQSVEEIGHYIDNQRGAMVLSIDDQFSKKLDAGKHVDVQLIMDGRRSNSTQIVSGYAARIIDQFGRDRALKSGISLQNTELVPRNWYNPNLIYYWYNVPSLCGLLTMLVALIVTALSVARERELGTFDQLLVSPLSPREILIGKTVAPLIISMIEGSIILLAAAFVFLIPFQGSVTLLYLSMFVFASSIVGVGLFISSLCATQQQAIVGTFVFMSPSVLLSGFATPIENMPEWLQYVTYIVPLRYFLVIAKGTMLKDIPADVVFDNMWPMAVIALFTLSAAAWLFRRRLE